MVRRLARFDCQLSQPAVKVGTKRDEEAKARRLAWLDSRLSQPALKVETHKDEEAKARRLARFGRQLSQPAVKPVHPPPSIAESSKNHTDIKFLEATSANDLCNDTGNQCISFLFLFLLAFHLGERGGGKRKN